MKFKISRENLLKPLQQVAGVVERRQTLPILSNILLKLDGQQLFLTGTDLEVEMVAVTEVVGSESGEITVPARKLLDICRELPDKADIEVSLNEQRLEIRAGRFKSHLSTLPAMDFPVVDTNETQQSVTVDSQSLKQLLELTGFAMAQQDVRYFLNGMLIEHGEGYLRSVATDGHRLAMNSLPLDKGQASLGQVIVPRKGVLELQRLLTEFEENVSISIGSSHLCLEAGGYRLTTKLIDGRFPDYERVIPRNGDKTILANKQDLRRALNRTAILSNEKFRGIRVQFSSGVIQLTANNPEQEDAEESVPVEYTGPDLEIGFNVGYLLDVLNVVRSDEVKITVFDENSSALLEDPASENALYVIMPMKL
ncbi:MAG: DNA polymerase III subunit beta [Pseudomonadales bacterium]|jgi:DNA polymerase-3 subunit beta|nr:DNA polymerase III subunit beta [Pseudomonadales bacterium]